MVPGEQQVTPNFGSFRATVPVGSQGMENRPGRHPFPLADFYAPSNTELFAPARTESEPCRRPYTASVWRQGSGPCVAHAISKLTPGTGRANPQGWQCTGTCAMQGAFLLPWRRTRDSDYRQRDRDTRRVPISVRR